MRRKRIISSRKDERGVVILLVAIVLLFVVGAMAVLAIDFVTFYTARSEAQQAADAAALTGARVMANSGATSDPADLALVTNAELLAATVAKQVATHNKVGGRNLVDNGSEIQVSFSGALAGGGGGGFNPRVTVRVSRADLPTFFAHIWGRALVTVTASATAEAYNPSGFSTSVTAGPPIAPTCVKPWLLPNLDPTNGTTTTQIFDLNSGAILNPALVGQSWPNTPGPNPNGLFAVCDSCTTLPGAQPGQYYPGAVDALDFPVPTQALPSCSTGFNAYQIAVAGCVQRPIACGGTATIQIDTSPYTPTTTSRNADTFQATKCLIHDNGANGDSDSIDPTWVSGQAFQFVGGNANPVAGAVGQNILVSDSLVTVPVFNSTGPISSPVTVIGFVQLFLNSQAPGLPANQIQATIINMAGCGTSASGQPMLGNGASTIPVRLTSP